MQDNDKNKDSSNSGDNEWNSSPAGGRDMGDDYFFNNEGFVVFTEKYLLERGYCCGNGCRNCPYDYKAVPEPKRSQLLEKRKIDGLNK